MSNIRSMNAAQTEHLAETCLGLLHTRYEKMTQELVCKFLGQLQDMSLEDMAQWLADQCGDPSKRDDVMGGFKQIVQLHFIRELQRVREIAEA